MSALPAVCAACRQPFAESGTSHRLALLEDGRAFCSDCLWRIDHPEADPREVAWSPRTQDRLALQPA